MKKLVLIIGLLLTAIMFVNAQTGDNMVAGCKGVTANINGLNGQLGFGEDKTRDISVGFSGYYVLIDNIALNVGVNFDYNNTSKLTFSPSIGLKKHWKNDFLAAISYEGMTYNGDSYKNSIKLEGGYDYYFTKTFYLEPSIYYQRSLGVNSIDRIGLSIGIGFCL